MTDIKADVKADVKANQASTPNTNLNSDLQPPTNGATKFDVAVIGAGSGGERVASLLAKGVNQQPGVSVAGFPQCCGVCVGVIPQLGVGVIPQSWVRPADSLRVFVGGSLTY